jgi:hypothetical protein
MKITGIRFVISPGKDDPPNTVPRIIERDENKRWFSVNDDGGLFVGELKIALRAQEIINDYNNGSMDKPKETA